MSGGEDHPSLKHLFYLGAIFLGDCNTVDCQIIVASKGWGEVSAGAHYRAGAHM